MSKGMAQSVCWGDLSCFGQWFCQILTFLSCQFDLCVLSLIKRYHSSFTTLTLAHPFSYPAPFLISIGHLDHLLVHSATENHNTWSHSLNKYTYMSLVLTETVSELKKKNRNNIHRVVKKRRNNVKKNKREKKTQGKEGSDGLVISQEWKVRVLPRRAKWITEGKRKRGWPLMTLRGNLFCLLKEEKRGVRAVVEGSWRSSTEQYHMEVLMAQCAQRTGMSEI